MQADPQGSLTDTFRIRMQGQRTVRREVWHPQGPHRSTQPPRATTFGGTAPPPDDGTVSVRAGRGAKRNVVARGEVVGRMGPCGCQAWDHKRELKPHPVPPPGRRQAPPLLYTGFTGRSVVW